jgi:hypothetical protein
VLGFTPTLGQSGVATLTTEVLEASLLLKKSRGVPDSGVSSPLATAEPLPEEIPLEALKKTVLPSPAPALPPVVVEITNGCGGGGSGDEHGRPWKFVMGRNMHGSCLQITEPELNARETGEKEAYMSAVLAQYKEILIEKTKFHLGVCVCVCCVQISLWKIVQASLKTYGLFSLLLS